ncbi:MAG: multicomponent Na+:H+ antiporter subunit [Thermococcaceae archaeon]|jgi:multicomponent Na+:H+ antiporter subunit F|uniref:monovalent cation/H+ antiporter complex subunit F n=1 Tax=Thermococcus sp. 101 C5 TaxID=2654197 RepID=UPI0007493115|nr:monovalent cation/H+ antiporter complex subunit F [Thermococcus sp. 101 C5]KUJ99370.1 MAG: Putative monovalent cation/H+ antiporter subunit F [Thermococcales archaeon 44_46]MDK2983497.1 multicomponent Na+:H+ antiporter subunit [Thermococcaceae archaeon]MDN5320964.1 multicomponent Na+:H+ antiporter subunit [Thermococcaceae archaeon]MPW40085.1 cation:proton antiporter [Thermococcus sp. 101 C5]HIH72516.1 cation:proton antiporter [Thermococcaceae archaeon]
MVEENLLVSPFGWGAIILVATSLVLSYRVLFGPTLADRIVGINTVTTKTVVILAIFGFIAEEYFFLDLAIVLLMVNAVGGLILAKYMEGRK